MDFKRPGELAVVPVSKRARTEVANVNKGTSIVQNDISRTSNLMAPTMLLEGQQGEIFTVEFHPEGQYPASAGSDHQIYILNVYGGVRKYITNSRSYWRHHGIALFNRWKHIVYC